MPKPILTNLEATCGKTQFDIYFDNVNNCIVLKKIGDESNGK